MVLPIFGNITDRAAWQPDPDGRGTSGLLQTCIATIALCVYSAIHLNIPAHKTTKAKKTFVKTSLVVLGLLAPELVVYFAWSQRRDAKAIVAALNEAHEFIELTPWLKRWRASLFHFERWTHQASTVENSQQAEQLNDQKSSSQADVEALPKTRLEV